ncbi:conserved hypothetical protein [Ricinus communis]|uniref:Uncharacterized protein n=1 Tax=Ricinus communis TaxID=3988 RepID=B9S2R8_RICCO|nr:conserved hypothetical protein [Ricinus communis]
MEKQQNEHDEKVVGSSQTHCFKTKPGSVFPKKRRSVMRMIMDRAVSSVSSKPQEDSTMKEVAVVLVLAAAAVYFLNINY